MTRPAPITVRDMPAVRHLQGLRFGRLLVLERAPIDRSKKSGQARWICRCDCGVVKTIGKNELTRGTTVSCGCRNNEHRLFFAGSTKTGGKKHPLYRIWSGMVARCTNPKHPAFSRYGGRGIALHPSWRHFPNFVADIMREIGARPSMAHTLDRRDNDGDYSPENLRWATSQQQLHNRARKSPGSMNGVLGMGC